MSTSPFTNASVPLDKLTPMLRQYVELKAERPDVVLLMRVGDDSDSASSGEAHVLNNRI